MERYQVALSLTPRLIGSWRCDLTRESQHCTFSEPLRQGVVLVTHSCFLFPAPDWLLTTRCLAYQFKFFWLVYGSWLPIGSIELGPPLVYRLELKQALQSHSVCVCVRSRPRLLFSFPLYHHGSLI
jgi:hypothetical protein